MHRFAADRLAETQRQPGTRLGVIARRQQFAQIDLLARRIGQFDADGVAARHHGDARRQRAHRAGDIVGEADDARRFDARRRLELVERHHRARPRIDDFAAHAEIAQHAFQRVAFSWISVRCSAWRARWRAAPSSRLSDGSVIAARGAARGLCRRARLAGAAARRPSSSSSSASSARGAIAPHWRSAARHGAAASRRHRRAAGIGMRPRRPNSRPSRARKLEHNGARRKPSETQPLVTFLVFVSSVVLCFVLVVVILDVAARKSCRRRRRRRSSAAKPRTNAAAQAGSAERAARGTEPRAAAAWRRRRRRRDRTAAANAPCAAGRRRRPRSAPRRTSTAATRSRSWASRRWPSSR